MPGSVEKSAETVSRMAETRADSMGGSRAEQTAVMTEWQMEVKLADWTACVWAALRAVHLVDSTGSQRAVLSAETRVGRTADWRAVQMANRSGQT